MPAKTKPTQKIVGTDIVGASSRRRHSIGHRRSFHETVNNLTGTLLSLKRRRETLARCLWELREDIMNGERKYHAIKRRAKQ